MNKAIDSLYESKSDRDICAELAPRLGIADYRDGRSNEEWLRIITQQTGDIPDFDSFKAKGYVKLKVDEPFVAFREQIEDPVAHPFPTLSGKIEIYCPHLAEMENPLIPPIAKYLPVPDGFSDPLSKKYPLQLVTVHHKPATHTTMERIPWLDEVEPRRVWINTRDAETRGISNGDRVLVFNDRGKMLMAANVTERIMPGVVSIGHGGWFELDANGVDHGGCTNILTPSEHSPGGAWCTNTVLVEVRKV